MKDFLYRFSYAALATAFSIQLMSWYLLFNGQEDRSIFCAVLALFPWLASMSARHQYRKLALAELDQE